MTALVHDRNKKEKNDKRQISDKHGMQTQKWLIQRVHAQM
jgi:hypothetical protein